MDTILKKYRQHALLINNAGGKLYIVGGAVRDFVMRRPIHDVDLCVTGLTIEQFKNIFPNARLQGKQFPVFVVDAAEIAFARTEKKTGIGYTGFEINANPGITIEEDLLRRDLTFNAMAVDILTHELIDPYGGTDDIADKLVRPTSEAFLEDPVRALRAARFAAEFDFKPTARIYKYIYLLKPEILTINENLKFKEFKRAMEGKAPWTFFETLKTSDVLDVAFPELSALDGMQQLNHYDGDAWEHTIAVLKTCCKLTNNFYDRVAALYHDTGKGNTPEDILPHHNGHELRSCDIIEELTWMPKDLRKYAKAIAFDHMRAHKYDEMKRGSRVRMLLRINKTCRGLEGFSNVVYADRPTDETIANLTRMIEDMAIVTSITGKDMPEDTPKGEAFGIALHERRCKALGIQRVNAV
ncbi:MAG: HD domain-containing protein [Candidatus Pacebacteria bacterium]|nr:HD domain-containing protein [Fermentimonas sp.]MDD4804415.1 HD domain-containing protein [Candidatus Paceibacterota bacterium]